MNVVVEKTSTYPSSLFIESLDDVRRRGQKTPLAEEDGGTHDVV